MLALKLEIFVEETGIISVRECRNVIVVNAELRGDAWVSDSGFGLTILSVWWWIRRVRDIDRVSIGARVEVGRQGTGF